jgi:hypothetical protein
MRFPRRLEIRSFAGGIQEAERLNEIALEKACSVTLTVQRLRTAKAYLAALDEKS